MTTEALADEDRLNPADLRTIWRILTPEERVEAFHLMSRDDAEEFFLGLSASDLAGLMRNLPRNERRSWMRLLAPDDAADLVQQVPDDERDGLLGLLDDPTRKEVTALLAYSRTRPAG